MKVGRRTLAISGAIMVLLSGACVAGGDLLRVELAFESPSQRMAQVIIDWSSGTVTGQVRTRVPGCEQPWHAACWTSRPVNSSLSSAQRTSLLQTLATVPLAGAPRHAAPGVVHYSVALVRSKSVGYGLARMDDGPPARAIEQAMAMAGAAP
jgi:hypothetical protein